MIINVLKTRRYATILLGKVTINKITLHKKWNTSVAILAGDAILALAFRRLNSTDNTIKDWVDSLRN